MSRGSFDVRIFSLVSFHSFPDIVLSPLVKKIRTPRYIRDCWLPHHCQWYWCSNRGKGKLSGFQWCLTGYKATSQAFLTVSMHRKCWISRRIDKQISRWRQLNVHRGATNSWKNPFKKITGHCPCNLPFSVNYALSLREWTWTERVNFFNNW
jgi:hypothetical protein